MDLLTAVVACVGAMSAIAVLTAEELHTFTRLQLTDQFWSEGATFGDLNNDKINDIVSGPWWWEGPDFKKRHEYYPAAATFQVGRMVERDSRAFDRFERRFERAYRRIRRKRWRELNAVMKLAAESPG